MSVPAGFVLGLLIGWLVGWAMDWFFWRQKRMATVPTPAESRAAAIPVTANTAELDALRTENARLEGQPEKLIGMPDDLKVITGVGPEIERRLNEAGIRSFAQLAELTPTDLERILGDEIRNLSNDRDLLTQAHELANRGK